MLQVWLFLKLITRWEVTFVLFGRCWQLIELFSLSLQSPPEAIWISSSIFCKRCYFVYMFSACQGLSDILILSPLSSWWVLTPECPFVLWIPRVSVCLIRSCHHVVIWTFVECFQLNAHTWKVLLAFFCYKHSRWQFPHFCIPQYY